MTTHDLTKPLRRLTVAEILELQKAATTPQQTHHNRTINEEYLKKLRKKAAWIKDVDPELWLNEIRGRDA